MKYDTDWVESVQTTLQDTASTMLTCTGLGEDI